MKKILLLWSVSVGIALGLQAQTIEFSYNGNVVGDTLNINVVEGMGISTDYIHMKNITDETVSFKVVKEKVLMAEGSDLLMCFAGNCLISNVSLNAIDVEPGATYEEFDFQYMYETTELSIGKLHIVDPSMTEEALDYATLEPIQTLVVRYAAQTVGLDKPTAEINASLNAYPNPVNGVANINYSMPSTLRNAKIVIKNMIGSEIESIDITPSENGNIQVSTSNIPNGVYFYSIIAEGRNLSTKKLVVKH